MLVVSGVVSWNGKPKHLIPRQVSKIQYCAIGVYLAEMNDMLLLAEDLMEVKILMRTANLYLQVMKTDVFHTLDAQIQWTYYLSHSTGSSHYIAYATSDNQRTFHLEKNIRTSYWMDYPSFNCWIWVMVSLLSWCLLIRWRWSQRSIKFTRSNITRRNNPDYTSIWIINITSNLGSIFHAE